MNRKVLLLSVLFGACSTVNKVQISSPLTLSDASQIERSCVVMNSHLNYTYETYISHARCYTPHLYLSHFLPISYQNSGFLFDNHQRFVELKPEKTNKKIEKKTTINILPWGYQLGVGFSFVRRITSGHLSKEQKPRVLVIGDSVTGGYGASSNKKHQEAPNQYWAYAKMLFEMEKIDNGDTPDEYNATFIGSYNGGNFTINYSGVERQIRARAEGYGGAALQQLFEPFLGNENTQNPFYDEENDTFSLLSYLSKYRTMDDNGERLVSAKLNPSRDFVKGSDGKIYEIGAEIKSQSLLETVDVCTPSIIVINLCHNTNLENYKSNIGRVVDIIRKELPNVKIVLMTIDETGTLFPTDYPSYNANQIQYIGLHDKNAKIYNYLRENVENERNGVYVFAAQFIMPTAEGFPTIENKGRFEQNPSVLAPHYHPNNRVHEEWGYALYSLIKYLIS